MANKLQDKRILLLSGGTSAEREISLESGKAIDAAMKKLGLNFDHLDTKDCDIQALKGASYDLAFIALHGRGGEDGVIQGVLDYIGINYTGSGVLGSSLAMDKLISKKVFTASHIPTAKFYVVYQGDDLTENKASHWLKELGGKIVIKPSREGSSIGMAIVKDEESLIKGVRDAFVYDSSVVLEQWLAGDEYTVGVLGDVALPPIRLQVAGEFYDYDAKYKSNKTQYLIPAGLSSERQHEIQALALKAFNAVDGRDWGRVDIMCDANGDFQVLEVNTVPGMTSHSLVPKAAAAMNINFEQLIENILSLADERGGAA